MSHLNDLTKTQLIQKILFLEKRIQELENTKKPDATSLTYRRGEADGRWRHPPAECSIDYLHGYKKGLELPYPESLVTRIFKRDDDR